MNMGSTSHKCQVQTNKVENAILNKWVLVRQKVLLVFELVLDRDYVFTAKYDHQCNDFQVLNELIK